MAKESVGLPTKGYKWNRTQASKRRNSYIEEPVTEGKILYGFSYMRNLKVKLIEAENRRVVARCCRSVGLLFSVCKVSVIQGECVVEICCTI